MFEGTAWMGLFPCPNFNVDVDVSTATVYRQTIGSLSVSARLYLASRSDQEQGKWIGKTPIWSQTGRLQQERVLNDAAGVPVIRRSVANTCWG